METLVCSHSFSLECSIKMCKNDPQPESLSHISLPEFRRSAAMSNQRLKCADVVHAILTPRIRDSCSCCCSVTK